MSQLESREHVLYDEDYFDRMHKWSSTDKYRCELDELLRGLGVTEGDLVLDVGCSTGNALRYVSDKTGCRVVGIDFPIEGLRQCKSRDIVRCDAHELPFKNSVFNKIYMLHVVGHVRCPKRVLGEIKRVLKPKGKFGIITPNKFFVYMVKPLNYLGIIRHKPDPTVLRYYSTGSLDNELRDVGLNPIRTYAYGKIPDLLQPFSSLSVLDAFRERVISISARMRK